MTDSAAIIIVDSDAGARKALSAFLEAHDGYFALCSVRCPKKGSEDVLQGARSLVIGDIPEGCAFEDAVRLAKPVRIGAVLDYIDKTVKKSDMAEKLTAITLGVWALDVVHNVLSKVEDTSTTQRLTEKEKEILVVLHENTNQSVSREDLLSRVWAYAEGVETHTLETHIYRLRQKIETDPADPKILLTTEAGYKLEQS